MGPVLEQEPGRANQQVPTQTTIIQNTNTKIHQTSPAAATSTSSFHDNIQEKSRPNTHQPSTINLPPEIEASYAGRLSKFYYNWGFTKNPTVLSWIRQGYPIHTVGTVCQDQIVLNNNFSILQIFKISSCIKKLLKTGAVSKCTPTSDQYTSKIFIVPKTDGSFRFILNLKQFNKFVPTTHFKLEDIRTALNLINRDYYMASLDLKDAYFLLKIADNSKKFLRFEFDKNLYQFNVLPFGLSSAPYVFNKIMRQVITYLRSKQITLVNYLDDFLFIAPSKSECSKNVLFACQFLQSLGFIINYEKSQLKPSKICKFLGFILNSKHYKLSIPLEKREKIYNKLHSLLIKKNCKIREFASLLGSLISICPAVPYGYLYTKILEKHKYLALLKCHENYEGKMYINSEIIQELLWWTKNVLVASAPIKHGSYKLELFSDASNTGWGIVCNDHKLHGYWSKKDLKHHINYLELLAIYFALKCFAKDRNNIEILIRSDNTTAVSYVNRMGSVRFPHLNNLSRKIWQFCEKRKLHIFASYIPSKQNVEADFQSRICSVETEWELAQYAYDRITTKLGVPEIDLFATYANKKCKKFISWHKEPGCWSVDAFTTSWSQLDFYAFPPFSLILRCLQKIQQDNAEGIMVVPDWPSQAWYPLFKKLLHSDVVYLKPNEKLLSSPFRITHPLHQNLSLIAGKLSAKYT